MTDKELVKRLRDFDPYLHEWEVVDEAADRIEELTVEREKDHANINLKADFIEKTLNQLAEAEAKLAKAVEGLREIADAFGCECGDAARTVLAEIEGAKT